MAKATKMKTPMAIPTIAPVRRPFVDVGEGGRSGVFVSGKVVGVVTEFGVDDVVFACVEEEEMEEEEEEVVAISNKSKSLVLYPKLRMEKLTSSSIPITACPTGPALTVRHGSLSDTCTRIYSTSHTKCLGSCARTISFLLPQTSEKGSEQHIPCPDLCRVGANHQRCVETCCCNTTLLVWIIIATTAIITNLSPYLTWRTIVCRIC